MVQSYFMAMTEVQHIELVFDSAGSKEIQALNEIASALQSSPDLLNCLRSLFGDSLDNIEELVGIPLCSCTADADKVIMRLEPSKGLTDLLSAVRTLQRRD